MASTYRKGDPVIKTHAVLFYALALFVQSAAASQFADDNPLVVALTKGSVKSPIAADPYFASAAKLIQVQTGNPGEVSMIAQRLTWFRSQPTCGRVAFALYQASTNTSWGQLGGQLNICKDGTPPLRICRTQSNRLVLPDATCPDGSPPEDTQEIKDVLAKAVQAGGLTVEKVQQIVRDEAKARLKAGGQSAK